MHDKKRYIKITLSSKSSYLVKLFFFNVKAVHTKNIINTQVLFLWIHATTLAIVTHQTALIVQFSKSTNSCFASTSTSTSNDLYSILWSRPLVLSLLVLRHSFKLSTHILEHLNLLWCWHASLVGDKTLVWCTPVCWEPYFEM